jgi:hypothetical protein
MSPRAGLSRGESIRSTHPPEHARAVRTTKRKDASRSGMPALEPLMHEFGQFPVDAFRRYADTSASIKPHEWVGMTTVIRLRGIDFRRGAHPLTARRSDRRIAAVLPPVGSVPSRNRTPIVMRHALTAMMVGVAMVCPFCLSVGSAESGADGAIAEARKQIRAGQYAAAVSALEDALAVAPRPVRPVILDLLGQAYQELIKKAEAAGRPRDAAHYRENLAIVSQSRALNARAPLVMPRKESDAAPVARPSPSKEIALVGPMTSGRPNARDSKAIAIAPRIDPTPNAPAGSLSEPTPLPEPAALPAPGSSQPRAEHPAPASAMPATNPSDPGIAMADVASPKGTRPKVAAESDRKPPEPNTAEADQLFIAHNYEEAGARYAALARQNLLPADRHQHWAYCRKVAVVRRINAYPRSSREWDEIEAEIVSIQKLMPNNWFGEYLSSYVAEARRTGRLPAAPARGVVVRGSAPEEGETQAPRFPRFLNRGRATAAPAQPAPAATSPAAPPSGSPAPAAEQTLELPFGTPKDAGAQAPPAPDEPGPFPLGTAVDPAKIGPRNAPTANASPVGKESDRPIANAETIVANNVPSAEPAAATDSREPAKPVSSARDDLAWQVYETPNFRIYHIEPELAKRAGDVAERVRTQQSQRWASPAARVAWSPRCDFYLYADGKHLARITGQAESAPGFSTMGTNGNKVITRLIHLRADHPELLAAVLPHEVTHVVMADLFAAQQIPRWADEGIAVLAEPAETQRLRAADLKEPLEAGGLIDLGKLMTMDYPAPNHLNLYYAQSISLTRFLVGQGPPDQFLRFVRHTQRVGVEPALKEVYQIEGLTALHDRWVAFARGQAAEKTASVSDRSMARGDRVSR